MKRRNFLQGIAALSAITGSKMTRAAGSSQDPFFMKEYIWQATADGQANAGYNVIDGKVPVIINPAANNCVIPIFGDSLGADIVPTAFTPVNANVVNFNPYSGGTYKAADPLLGPSGPFAGPLPANMFTRVADAVQGTGKFASTIIAPASIAGTLITQWATDDFSRIKATFARLASRSLTATAVLIQVGANDTQAGTSQATYTALQAQMIAIIRLYYAGPIFIATESWISGGTSAAIQAAQAAAVNHSLGIWAGPNGDSITNTGRQADQTHWNDTGSASMASLWLTALQAFGAPFV